ncbi:MAG: peptidoglycan DD-metalloendopeptidase family protein [Oscillospiraceae bacterium]|nr:peptidoglycan DD-metalloendopeptidase family protein [Oscillospiraceae bacterium]
MKKYTYQRNKKSRKEKIGFFTAFSICIAAIGLALWSTFLSIGGVGEGTGETYVATLPEITEAVGAEVTGVTVTEEVTEAPASTAEPTEETTAPFTTAEPYTGESQGLQTILQVTKSLDYPLHAGTITKTYSEEAVYNETMSDYRPHLGVDFRGDMGENVMSMSDGVVESIYKDDMLGNVIKVTDGNFSVYYCGVSDIIYCAEGTNVTRGEVITKVGEVPFEAKDEMHLHIEVKVGDKNIDPLMIIASNQ